LRIRTSAWSHDRAKESVGSGCDKYLFFDHRSDYVGVGGQSGNDLRLCRDTRAIASNHRVFHDDAVSPDQNPAAIFSNDSSAL
jgi:hypothetical protein